MQRLPTYFFRKFYLMMVIIVVLAGLLSAWGIVTFAAQKIHKDLLREAILFSGTLEPQKVKTLSGSASDINSAAYQQIRGELIAIRDSNPRFRLLHLMGRKKDGSLIYLVDSEPFSSEAYAAPGLIYSEATPEFRAAIEAGSALVLGPLSDRWGSWVTTLVPLREQPNGEIVAWVRFDLPAGDWYLELGSLVGLPLALLVVVLVGFCVILYALRPHGQVPTRPILKRLLAPIAAIMLILLLGIEGVFWQQQQQSLVDKLSFIVSDVNSDLNTGLEQQARSLAVLIQPVALNPAAKKALLARDTASLSTDWDALFLRLQAEDGLEHFRFLDASRACLLALENPQGCDPAAAPDHLTLLEAESSGKLASGLELDSLGILNQWVVQPVFAAGRLVGYIETGKSIEPVIQSVSAVTGTSLSLLISKQTLSQQIWQNGLRLLGRNPEWNRLSNAVISYSSQGRLPDAFVGWAEGVAANPGETVSVSQITSNGQPWQVEALPMRDPSGRQLGSVLVMLNITNDQADINRRMSLSWAIGLTLLVFLLGVNFFLLQRTDRFVYLQQLKLQESEMQFRSIFLEHSAVMLLIEPGSGRILDANPAASKFFGYPEDRLKSMLIDQLNSLEPGQGTEQRAAALALEKNYFRFPYRLASGEIREVETYSSPIEFGAQSVLFSIIHDISEREQAEIALQREKEALAKLQSVSEKFLENPDRELDYQKIVDDLLEITGAKYAIFNLFEENGREFRTVSIAGLSDQIQKADSFLGFNLIGKKWPQDKVREAKIKHQTITRFDSLHDLTGDGLPQVTITLMVKIFGLGEVVVAKISTAKRALGDFSIVMAAGHSFSAYDQVALYIRQVGLLLQRRQAETELRESQAIFQKLVEQIPEVVYTKEIGKGWQYFSPKILALSGYSAIELTADQQLWLNLILEEDRARVKLELLNLAVGDVWDSEYRIQTRERGEIWVRDHGQVQGTGQRGTKIIQGLLSEVTAQKQTEAALRESEERYRQLFENSLDGVLLMQDGKIYSANPAAMRLFGRSEQELALLERSDLFDPQDARVEASAESRLRSGSFAGELTALRKDGSRFQVEVSTSFYTDRESKLRAGLFIKDITARKSAEQALLASQVKLSEAQRLAQIGSWEVDLLSHQTSWSQEIYRIFGLDPQQYHPQGSSYLEFIHPSDREHIILSYQKAIEQGSSFLETHRILLKDGSTKYVEVQSEIVRDENGLAILNRGTIQDVTERIRGQESLRASQDRLTEAQRMAHIGDWEVDLAKSETTWSPEIYRIFGLDPQQFGVHRNSYIELLHPSEREETRQFFKKAMTSGTFVHETHRLLLNDGSLKYVEVQSEPVRDEKNETVLVRGTIQDVTERKQAEAALQISEQRYRLLVDNSSDLIWSLDSKAIFTYASPSWERLTGYLPADLLGKSLEPLIYPLDLPGFLSIYQEIIATGSSRQMPEFRFQQADGSWHWHAVSVSPIFASDGSLSLVGVSRDVTERRSNEAALRESEVRFRSLFEDSPISLWEEDYSGVQQRLQTLRNQGIVDFESYFESHPEMVMECVSAVRVLNVNNATLLLFGASNQKQLEKNLALVMPRAALPQFRDELIMIASGISRFEIETINRTLDGRLITVNMNWTVVPGYEADLSKILVSLVDITERKLTENHLAETNLQLKESVSLSKKLAERAEQANIAKSDFLANMSHEIRTPMNGVVGMTHLLLTTNLDPEQRRYAETVRSSGEALLVLINDILDFSKIEAGKLELELIDFNLLNLLDELAANLGVPAHQKGLELLCAAEPNVPALLLGDPGRLRQVLTNLVGNAIKFTQVGEVTVRVECLSIDQQDVELRFSVRDTGIGIPAEKMDLLFNKFSQVDASTTREYGGSGLGLAISRQLAELMGGEIGVKSEPGLGSEFWFSARLQSQRLEKAREADEQTSLKDVRVLVVDDIRSARDIPRIITPPGTHILLVEDNSTNQAVALGILKRIGLSADAVANGQEALKALEQNIYALVLMDVQMPVMDGLEATRHIRDHHSAVSNHMLPVIAMTAHALQGDRDRCLEAGMNDYVSKPVDPRALADTLARWVPGAYLEDKAMAMARAEEKRLTTAIKLPPVFDKAGVLDRLMGDEELARVVFAGFLEDIPHQILILKDYLEKEDAVSSERQAHTIKGAAANIGGEALRAVAFEMEKSGKAGDLPAVRARMHELQAQFERLKKALEAEL